jgi:hypothetical protein
MPRKKKIPELILTYYEQAYYCDCDEDDSNDYIEEDKDWSPLKLFLDEPDKNARDKANCWEVESLSYQEGFKVGDTVWLVVVRYTTGGTFSCTHGCWRIEDIVSSEEKAIEIKKMIEDDEKALKKWNLSHPCYLRTKNEPPQSRYRPGESKCWEGYFNSLDGVEIHEIKIE